jgi:hypothetical protein
MSWAVKVCSHASGKLAFVASGKLSRPSTQQIKTSWTLRRLRCGETASPTRPYQFRRKDPWDFAVVVAGPFESDEPARVCI